MITTDGTRTGSTVKVHNTNKRVKCVTTPMDKTETEKQEDIDIPCVISL